jgi:hypothetical protein
MSRNYHCEPLKAVKQSDNTGKSEIAALPTVARNDAIILSLRTAKKR